MVSGTSVLSQRFIACSAGLQRVYRSVHRGTGRFSLPVSRPPASNPQHTGCQRVMLDKRPGTRLDGVITRDVFDMMAVAINTGTNIPSVATPNGQAAFLFLLTSAIAPLIRLSYGRMVLMALPYTISMSIVGFLTVYYVLHPATDVLYEKGLISHHSVSAEVPGEVKSH